MAYPHITHHGADQGVTGSCHQLHLQPGISLLVDCGLFQGAEAASPRKLSAAGVQALVITHVHIDHVGRTPQLLAAGFKGPIICSQPSAKLLPLVLEDAFKLSYSRDPHTLARYLELINSSLVEVPYGQWHTVYEGAATACRIRLQRAGHILGSAYVECDITDNAASSDHRVVFSGDLGARHTPFLRPPQPPERADVLVLESTYGDRLHQGRSNRQQRLEQVIDKALADHGTILIPAFSIGRTQELLYEIEDILHRKSINPVQTAQGSKPIDWPQLPIILDSPLASRFTRAYREMDSYWDEEARQRQSEGRQPLHFRQLITLDSHQQHQATVNYLASTGRPAIVIAGNGMCSSGRIVNYLKAMLSDRRHHVVFVGYQAKGTPGAVIQACEGARDFVSTDLDGVMVDVRAQVSTLGGYSAHADQAGLLEFVTGMQQWPSEIRLVHGERKAKQALAQALTQAYLKAGANVSISQ